jgi:hypothetical protein
VVRYGPQEETVPLWLANALGLGRVHGRDWPCKGQNRYGNAPIEQKISAYPPQADICEGRQAALPA